jgi:antitoxin component YwqK of YwqJK toxin-antitoxin module
MKINLILVFLLLSLQGICQDVLLNLYCYNPCNKEVKKIHFFGVKKDNKVFSVEDSTGVLQLKDIGVYTLSYALDMIDSTQLGKEYHFNSIGSYSDTLKLMSINSCLEPTSHPNFIGYCCCGDEKCEGKQIDYYANGNKRIEGFFNKGKPIGELIFYKRDGSINYIEKYNKKGKFKKKITL